MMLVSEINVPMNMFGRSTRYDEYNKKFCFLSFYSNANFDQISTFYSVDFFIYYPLKTQVQYNSTLLKYNNFAIVKQIN